MSDMTTLLKLIADNLRKLELEEIYHKLDDEERQDFVNSVRTLQEPATYICQHLDKAA